MHPESDHNFAECEEESTRSSIAAKAPRFAERTVTQKRWVSKVSERVDEEIT